MYGKSMKPIHNVISQMSQRSYTQNQFLTSMMQMVEMVNSGNAVLLRYMLNREDHMKYINRVYDGETLLSRAVNRASHPIIQLLLELGATSFDPIQEIIHSQIETLS